MLPVEVSGLSIRTMFPSGTTPRSYASDRDRTPRLLSPSNAAARRAAEEATRTDVDRRVVCPDGAPLPASHAGTRDTVPTRTGRPRHLPGAPVAAVRARSYSWRVRTARATLVSK